MWRWVSENGRALRALTALCAAVGLAALLFSLEQAHLKSRSNTVHAVTSTLWSMSELLFEGQRAVAAIEGHAAGQADLAELQLRFDILWSRVDVAAHEALNVGGVFDHLLERYTTLLSLNDPLIFGNEPPTATQLQQLADQISALNFESRRAWSMAFGTGDPVERFGGGFSENPHPSRLEWFAFVLIATLLSYVLAEVYFANRGQRQEAVLRHAAAEANAAKTRFLANVSHEIRTPLNGILGMASELSETSLTKDQTQCLRIIEQSGGVLLGTINDVLDLSRIEAGQLSVEERAFVLRDLVEAACALYGAAAREKGLYLKLDIQDNLPPVLIGDAFRIRQVLHNLISNAVKFTTEGGVMVRVRPDLDGERLTVAVQDSGPGIERDAQARIFEPFQQADSSVTRQYGGTGLGLTISRQLCQAMGGDLMVVSRTGHGATFFCDLPLRAASDDEAKQVQRKPAVVPELAGVRILVADDNATNRLILSRFLAPTRAQPDVAENGKVALEAAQETEFEVILMDVQMPVMDGVAATRQIRSLERVESRAPAYIVGVTANVLSHQVASYLEAGMDKVLSKPLSKRDLFAVLAARPDPSVNPAKGVEVKRHPRVSAS